MAIIKTSTKNPNTGAPFRWLPRTGIRKPPHARTFPAKTPVHGNTSRERVLKVLKRFRQRCNELRHSNVQESRVDLKALAEFKEMSIGDAKSLGSIPGVEVGDEFEYRAELMIVGVHKKLQNGIDYTAFKGRSIATCVVAKEGYYDKMNDPNVLVYGGEGGGISSHKKKKIMEADDQVMKRGNLAMKNSIEVKNGVRVVRGVKVGGAKSDRVVYVYDGVYRVLEWRKVKGLKGNMVFEFVMRREPGQKTIDWKNYS